MRRLSLALFVLLASAPAQAQAVCPGHAATLTASATGGFAICPSTTDVDGDLVPVTGYYASCTVIATWSPGKTATAVITAPVPGTIALVSFPAAKGLGAATGSCVNTDGAVSAVASSVVTFRRGLPAKPSMSP